MIKSNRFLVLTILISVTVHILVIVLFDRFAKKEIVETEKQYTEVEYLPREEEPKPPPVPPPPVEAPAPRPPIENEVIVPLDDMRETTLDHDRDSSDKKTPEPEEQKEEPSRPMLSEPVIDRSNETTHIDRKDILDTRDITERIANSRAPVKKKGEDTASYNKFQEKYASYFGKFRKRIYQIWQYPPAAAARGETGVVSVTFSILKDGSIVNIKLVRSSGFYELDREVMRVLKSFGNLPLPASYELEQLNIDEAYFYYDSREDISRWIR